MEQLHNGFTLELCNSAFPLSTDSIVLSGFVRLPRQAKVLDLGSGCGTLGLLLCANDPGCTVTGVELDPHAHDMALHNAQSNGLTTRLSSICADLRSIHTLLPASSFATCVSNPPYFSAGPKSRQTPLARHDTCCTPEELFSAARRALQYGGDFYLVHKPDKLAQLRAIASAHHLEPKRLCLMRHKENGPIALILLACRKGGKPGLVIEELSLQDASGNPTQAFLDIYHQ